MIIMNGLPLFVCFVFSLNFYVSNAAETLFLTPGVKANVTSYRYYECTPGSHIRQLQSSARFASNAMSCNAFTYDNKNSTYVIKLANNQSHDMVLSLNSYTVTLNGNSIFMQNGKIESGVCAGGYIDELTFAVADDQNGCLGKGLAQVTPVYATFRISGGKCESECTGGVTTLYDPPIINSSNDISFKSC